MARLALGGSGGRGLWAGCLSSTEPLRLQPAPVSKATRGIQAATMRGAILFRFMCRTIIRYYGDGGNTESVSTVGERASRSSGSFPPFIPS